MLASRIALDPRTTNSPGTPSAQSCACPAVGQPRATVGREPLDRSRARACARPRKTRVGLDPPVDRALVRLHRAKG
jgi:hypothetical protein